MIDDGTYTAVLDRLEGDLAVLVVEDDGEAIDDLAVDSGALPEGGREPDTVLAVEIADGELVEAVVDATETERRADRAQDRFDRLARRPPSADGEEDPADGEDDPDDG